MADHLKGRSGFLPFTLDAKVASGTTMDSSKMESQVVRRSTGVSNTNGAENTPRSNFELEGANRESEKKTISDKAVASIKNGVNNCCSLKFLKKRLPILEWLPKYSAADLLGDSIAGLTVALATIPQCIAYTILADLPPIYGLYCSFIGVFLYVVFGTSRVVSVGPSAVTSLLTFDYAGGNPIVATFLAFISGCVLVFSSFLNLGFVLSFVSKPVFSGFVSGAAIAIMSSQLKLVFGIKIKPRTTLEAIFQTANHITETKYYDLALGVSTMAFLLILKKIKSLKRFEHREDDTPGQYRLKRGIFLLSVSSNAIVVIIATIIAMVMDESHPFSITGEIAQGLPPFKVPQFSMNNGAVDFYGMLEIIGIGVVLMPLITVIENVAIVTAFSGGKAVDVTQEMFAVGISNLAGSFLQGYPITASFSRSAINGFSGVRTQGGGVIVGTLVILALLTLAPYFKFIPLATLGAVVIISVGYMIEYEEIPKIWKVRKVDEIGLWATFLVCIFWKLQYGIVCGMVVNLLVLLYNSLDPDVEVTPIIEEFNMPSHVVVQSKVEPHYISITKLRNKIRKISIVVAKGIYPVVVDCHHFTKLDFSVGVGLTDMAKDFKIRSQPLIFTNANEVVENGLKSLSSDIKVVSRDDLLNVLFKLNEIEVDVPSEKFSTIEA